MAEIIFTFDDGSEAYLEHHGIKGMKWGVRRYQNADGSLTDKGRLRYTDSATRKQLSSNLAGRRAMAAQKKINKFERKIQKTGDEGLLRRNLINDRRRGRITALELKRDHLAAVNEYKTNKTAENKQKMEQAKKERYIQNGANHVAASLTGIYGNNWSRGKMRRYVSSGHTTVEAVLKTSGSLPLFGIGYGANKVRTDPKARSTVSKAVSTAKQQATKTASTAKQGAKNFKNADKKAMAQNYKNYISNTIEYQKAKRSGR